MEISFSFGSRIWRCQPVRQLLCLIFSQGGARIAGLIANLFLVGFIKPADYGLMAVALFYLNLCNLVEFGWEQGLLVVQKDLFEQQFRAILALRLVLFIFPIFCLWLGINFSRNSHELHGLRNSLWWVILALSISYSCEKLASIYRTCLERHNLLTSLAMGELASNVLGLIAACLLAFKCGGGIMVLIGQRLFSRISMLLIYIWACPFEDVKLKPAWHWPTVQRVWQQFGLATWLVNAAILVLYDLPAFANAHWNGLHHTGLLVRAMTLACLPQLLAMAFKRLAIPFYAKHTLQVAELRYYFLRFIYGKALILLPLQLGAAIAASWWIPLFLSAHWVACIPYYQALSIYGLLRCLYEDAGPLLAIGLQKPWLFARVQILQTMLLVISMPLFFRWSPNMAAAWAMNFSMIVSGGYLFYILQQHLNLFPVVTQSLGLASNRAIIN